MTTRHIVEGIAVGASMATLSWFGWLQRERIKKHFRGLLGDEEAIVRVSGLLETFFNEASVLWFVFPLLDAIYEVNTNHSISVIDAVEIAGVTWTVALGLFYFAAFFKKLEKEGEKRLALRDKGKDH